MATRRRICRIRVLAKMAILENWPDSIHSPTFANLFWPDSIHSLTFANLFWSDSIHSPTFANLFSRTRYIRRHSPTCFGRTRYICRHSPKGFFEKNVTRLDTFARVIRHWGEWPLLNYYPKYILQLYSNTKSANT